MLTFLDVPISALLPLRRCPPSPPLLLYCCPRIAPGPHLSLQPPTPQPQPPSTHTQPHTTAARANPPLGSHLVGRGQAERHRAILQLDIRRRARPWHHAAVRASRRPDGDGASVRLQNAKGWFVRNLLGRPRQELGRRRDEEPAAGVRRWVDRVPGGRAQKRLCVDDVTERGENPDDACSGRSNPPSLCSSHSSVQCEAHPSVRPASHSPPPAQYGGNSGQGPRLFARSDDGGQTWAANWSFTKAELPAAYCEGSLISDAEGAVYHGAPAASSKFFILRAASRLCVGSYAVSVRQQPC